MDEALSLLQNLLGWAKSESDQIQVIPENLDLKDIVDQTFRLLKLGSEHKKITLDNKVSEATCVHADLNTTKTVLRNLLSNAIKFTPFEGRIKVNAISSEENIIIEVQDNGQGIPPEDIPEDSESK